MGGSGAHALYTIGHSNHDVTTFISLLKRHGVTLVADVRSLPYSQYCSQFNKEILSARLRAENIRYIYLGRGLGGRPKDPCCDEDGFVDFWQMANRQEFRQAIVRLLEASAENRVALMCAEKDPLDCHRFFLVCRAVKEKAVAIRHILQDGSIEEHSDTEKRMVEKLGIQATFFESHETGTTVIDQAYERLSRRIYQQSADAE